MQPYRNIYLFGRYLTVVRTSPSRTCMYIDVSTNVRCESGRGRLQRHMREGHVVQRLLSDMSVNNWGIVLFQH
eukprot:1549050-Amphidinium_carterae.1